MTALEEALAKADEVLALDEKATAGPWHVEKDWTFEIRGEHDMLIGHIVDSRNAPMVASYRTAAPDLARALKAVAECMALFDDSPDVCKPVIDQLRAAIERRLTEGK